ncbi:Serine/threonine-protein kinase PknD [Planctomycetes bacterium CA13]|uniref:Serine/threonine-protein kinase PknD n=1 Tax=Novipirellula herctigrandis TaxID=2527986 RepID=A0A5C5YZC7_9BACT|nr:Serine/threonine-protein kinase PknD [Planctomycetes bacterium CA13]
MADSQDVDLEAIVKAASCLPPKQREQFVLLLPATVRAHVLDRLEALSKANVKLRGLDEGTPTVAENPSVDVDDVVEASLSKSNPTVESVDGCDLPTLAMTQDVIRRDKTIVMSCDSKQSLGDKSSDSNSDFNEVADDGFSDSQTASKRSRVRLVRRHARGAIGEVFVAYDGQLSREVALKRIRPELPPSKRRVRRFIREAVITAKLQHPGIVPIYDLGDDGLSAHYTMPLVSGSTLTALIEQTHHELGSRPTREEWMSKLRPLLTHFIAVCNAIDYAHSQRVLHRDLKPSNIIIGSQGQTLVLDWGCAKNIGDLDSNDGLDSDDGEMLTEAGGGADITVAGSVMGTIGFMSPEQASGENEQVGTASDIFGLGATLFCVLTGDLAFKSGSNIKQALEEVRQAAFRRVDEIDPRVPAPLVAICHHAMERSPEDRYRSAGDLGRDIDAFLAGEQVTAYREPLRDRLKRFAKRHQTAVATLLGTFLVGFVALVFVTLMIEQQRGALSEKNQQLDFVNDQLEKAVVIEDELIQAGTIREESIKRQLYETQMLLASEASSEPGGVGRMRELIDRWRGDELKYLRGWEWHHLDALGHRELWKVDVNSTANRVLFTRDHPNAKVFDAGQSLITTINVVDEDSVAEDSVAENRVAENSVAENSVAENRVAERIMDVEALPKNVTVVDYNRDQSLLAMGLTDGKVIVVHTTDANFEPVEFIYLDSSVTDVCWNIGGDYLAASDASGELAVWQWYERQIRGTGQGVLNQPGKRLLTWSYDGQQVSWTTGTEIRRLTMKNEHEDVIARDDWIVNPCWSHEGKLLAYIGPENSIVVTDPISQSTNRYTGHQLFVESLAWHPNQHFLLSASADGTVRIWNADTHKQVEQLLGHSANVYAAAWSRDGKKVVSGGLPEDSLHVWDVSNLGKEAFDRELQDHPAVAWFPNGDQLAVAERGDILLQNSIGDSKWIRSKEPKPPEIFAIDVADSEKQIACVSASGRIWTIDIESGDISKVYDSGGRRNQFPEITSKGVAWSADGRYLAGVGAGGKLRVWDVASGEDIGTEIEQRGTTLVVAWVPKSAGDPTLLAYAGTDDNVYVFDPDKREVIAEITQYGWKTSLAWSGEGTRIAVGDRRNISIWDVETESLIATCDGPSAMVWDVSWNDSQNRIAALTEDGRVSVWNSLTWKYCGKFNLHDRAPYSIRWSPDGKRLVSTARYGRIVFQDIDH